MRDPELQAVTDEAARAFLAAYDHLHDAEIAEAKAAGNLSDALIAAEFGLVDPLPYEIDGRLISRGCGLRGFQVRPVPRKVNAPA